MELRPRKIERENPFSFWKIFLVPVFFFIFIHFLKDITQDILGIKTLLDVFGNIQEDISSFPEWLVWFYHWAMVNTFFMEAFLIYSILKTFKRKKFVKEDKINLALILYIGIMFTIAILLSLR